MHHGGVLGLKDRIELIEWNILFYLLTFEEVSDKKKYEN